MTAGVYCRLSKEDEDRTQESESIQNQRSLLLRYAAEQGWDVADVYCDEDYSGADRERPEFRRLIADARAGRLDVVLVKTQSRFTRDMELVEKYLHGLFPLWGVRFVAVVDNVDTAVKGNKKARQINGLINEWYLEDLSENIRAVFDDKRRAGQYIGSFPLYGYRKDPGDRNRLVVDPEAAGVVRQIFGLYLSGLGKQRIAAALNAQGVPNPTRYKRLMGLDYANGGERDGDGAWSRTTVGRILRERMYTGDLVQGRRRKASYKSKTLVSVPREEWVVVPNTHEAIIDKAAFAAVQRLLDGHTKSDGTGRAHLLAGRAKCLDCGGALSKASTTYQGRRRSYLRCPKCGCSIRQDALEEAVTGLLRGYLERWRDPGAAERLARTAGAGGRREALEREAQALAREEERRSKALRSLYLDRTQGVLGEEEFRELNRAYLDERESLRQRLAAVETELERGAEAAIGLEARVEAWLDLDPVPRELVAECVARVEVGRRDKATGEQTVKITWAF